MLAIPVFRDRVAPVFDWCSRIIIIPEKMADEESIRQIDVKENTFKLMRRLQEQGIRTLICGAMSSEALNYGRSIGLKIIHGIAGEIQDVLQAYRDQKLDQPQYCLPGCREKRRQRRGKNCTCPEGDGMMVAKTKPGGAGSARKGPSVLRQEKRRGAGGFCICPRCGLRTEHEQGTPCSETICPSCRLQMIRE